MQQDDPVFRRIVQHKSPEENDAEFARRINVDPATFSEWKRGKSKPSRRDTLLDVSDGLGVSVDYLLRGEEHTDDRPNRPAIADQLRKVIEWIQGEAVDWDPTSGGDLPVGEIDTLGDDARAAGGD